MDNDEQERVIIRSLKRSRRRTRIRAQRREQKKAQLGPQRQFNRNVAGVIAEFVVKKPIKLLDWIKADELFWIYLHKNKHPDVFDVIDNYKNIPKKISFFDLMFAKYNVDETILLEKSQDKVESIREYLRNRFIPERMKIEELATSKNKMDWDLISINPTAVPILKKNFRYIRWDALSSNTAPEAIELLSKNPSKINWHNLCLNEAPEAIKLLERYPSKIDWPALTVNSSAIYLLERYEKKIHIPNLIYNKNAGGLIRKYVDKIRSFGHFSQYPEAIELLEQYPDKIDWIYLALNPAAIYILEKNKDKIDWYYFSKNPMAIHILEKNKDKIDWSSLAQNINIFEVDEARYKQLKAECAETIYNIRI